MLIVHHLGVSQSERIVWLCEELGIPYPYFAGPDFTAADIMMFFAVSTARSFAVRDVSEFSNIRAYLRRIGERPAYRRAMAKADPHMTPKLE